MKKKLLFLFVLTSLFALIIAGCSNGAGESNDSAAGEGNGQGTEGTAEKDGGAAEGVQLPDKLTLTTYDVGSGGHTQLTAISDALAKEYGTQIRMIPSASGLGRLAPLKDGTADIGGRLGDEVYFAFEGIEEYATQQWGPQDVTYIYPILNPYGFFVLEDSDIETIADLKGKKVPYIIGNSSVNVKIEAMLAAAGLTLDDVELVDQASYSDQPTRMAQGQIDVSAITSSGATVYEADELHGIRWLELDFVEGDDEALKRMQEVYPFGFPREFESGAAISKDDPQVLMGYSTYAPAVYRDQDPDLVYNFLKALDETFDVFNQASEDMWVWSLDEALPEPLGVPLHEGAIKFFKEKDMWNDEYQKKNDELLERQQKLQEAWETVVAEASEKGLSEEEFSEYWLERKAELVD